MPRNVRFEWDPEKAEANRQRHRISFALAQEVFNDEYKAHIHRGDEHGEERWWTIGLVGSQLLIVVHTWEEHEDEDIIRIISARKATPSERRRYEES